MAESASPAPAPHPGPADTESPHVPRVQTRKIGGIRVHALDAGLQRLDGGAMFGVVPKPLWERRIAADARNRIPLGLRCLLIEAPEALVLVDTGIGNKEDARFHDVYGVENAGSPTRLEDAIREAGHTPEAVDLVVLTHLHFDHVGGATFVDPAGVVRPAFPRARYVVQEGELAFAALPNERIRASYLERNLAPLVAAGRLETLVGDVAVTRGVSVLRTPGHTPHHQSVLVSSAGETLCALADVCPTTAHIPLPWIMGYDLEPLVTLETKRSLWARAQAEDWLLFFEHDPRVAWGHLDVEGRGLL
jgi:glyoxylase-like metal-dependent hydrolase (beta-lactamase superfamily II)